MNALVQAVLARLAGDATLAGMTGVEVFFDRQPDDPKVLSGPKIVVGVPKDSDRVDDHGGAVDVTFEVRVWGYDQGTGADPAGLIACYQAANRVTGLLLKPFSGVDGWTTRIGGTGWQRVEDTDPLAVHLFQTFSMLYWSTERIAAITS